MPRRAAVYVRISADRVGAGLGVARQEEDCRAVADRLGWTVAEVFVDNDISAYSGKKRPGYLAMLDAARAGSIGAIIAWHTDRLHRSPRELEEFIDVCEQHAIAVQTAQAGPLDLSTPSGRMAARIHGAVARHESEHKAERIRRANEQGAQAGRPTSGGPRPFGYEPDRVTVRQEEAKVLREMVRRFVAGDSLYGIAGDLNSRGIRTAGGRTWVAQTVRQTIARPRYAGLREHRGVVVGKAAWRPIITVAQHEAVLARLADPARRTIDSPARKHLLTGIARCGVCDAPVRVAVGVHDGKVYRCPAVHVSRHLEHVDAWVRSVVLRYLAEPDFARAFGPVGSSAEQDLADEIAAVRKQREKLADDHADAPWDPALFRRQLARLDQRLTALQGRLTAETGRSALAPFATGRDPARVWKGLTLAQRRATITALVTVTIDPARRGRGFDPTTVRVERR